MYCKKCGHQMDDDARFCPECGEKQQPKNLANDMDYVPFSDATDRRGRVAQKKFMYGKAVSTGSSGKIQFGDPDKKPGLFKRLFRFIIIVIVLMIAYFIFFGESAPVYNIEFATTIDNTTFEAVSPSDTFSTTTPKIYIAFTTQDLVTGDVIEGTLVDESGTSYGTVNYTADSDAEQIAFFFNQPTSGWPVGEYTVTFYVNSEEVNNATFNVE